MTLIKSISGIRGTIGGIAGENLTPDDLVKFSAAFAALLKAKSKANKIVIGRDARVSGPLVSSLVCSTIRMMGTDVVDLGPATTPTVEMAVKEEGAGGGIIITASHNPAQWNALKLLNEAGEFISESDGKEMFQFIEQGIAYAEINELGSYTQQDGYLDFHIRKILELPLVDPDSIKAAGFRIVVDAVNSVGGIAVPKLLQSLGVEDVIKLYCEPSGKFPHNPEPLPEFLSEITREVEQKSAHLGIVVDPDVDRLAIVCEDGSMFGEEYTLVAVSDYVLSHQKGNTVSNLSSSKALREITEKAGGQYFASAVGEVHVVAKMKEVDAVIGGEGNGGIIYPELHYGRDALVGIALFLTHLAKYGKSCSMLRARYPKYHMVKKKVTLAEEDNLSSIFDQIEHKYRQQPIDKTDGLKIEFDENWAHLRKSNTEPIVRIYAEGESVTTAENIVLKLLDDIRELRQPPPAE